MGEVEKYLEPLDGKFTVEEESGFGCDRCGHLLLVGSYVCPKCRRQFKVPTPSLKKLAASKHPSKIQGMALIYSERLITSEIQALLKLNPNGFLQK